MFFLLLLCLDLHLKIIIWASSTRTVTVSIVTIGFSHLLDFCGEHNNSGGKQLGRDHLQWERKLGTVSWYTETCFKRTCLGRQGLEGIWFYSNFILVHIDNRHDLWCNQLRYRHAVAMLSPRSRLRNPRSFIRYFLQHYQARGSIVLSIYNIWIISQKKKKMCL